jgi:hypothetical protein
MKNNSLIKENHLRITDIDIFKKKKNFGHLFLRVKNQSIQSGRIFMIKNIKKGFKKKN